MGLLRPFLHQEFKDIVTLRILPTLRIMTSDLSYLIGHKCYIKSFILGFLDFFPLIYMTFWEELRILPTLRIMTSDLSYLIGHKCYIKSFILGFLDFFPLIYMTFWEELRIFSNNG